MEPTSPAPLAATMRWGDVPGLRTLLLRQAVFAHAPLPLFYVLLYWVAIATPTLGVVGAIVCVAATSQLFCWALISPAIIPAQRRPLLLACGAAGASIPCLPGCLRRCLEGLQRGLSQQALRQDLPIDRKTLLAMRRSRAIAITTPDGCVLDGIVVGYDDPAHHQHHDHAGSGGDGTRADAAEQPNQAGEIGTAGGAGSSGSGHHHQHQHHQHPQRRPSRGIMIYMGGNGEHWEKNRWLHEWADRGITVMAVNPRGIGLSTGNTTRHGLVIDAASVIWAATACMGFPASQIIVFGHSLGGGVSAQAARLFRGLLLVNDRSFSSLATAASTVALAPQLHVLHARRDLQVMDLMVKGIIRFVACCDFDTAAVWSDLAARHHMLVIDSAVDGVILPRAQLRHALLQRRHGSNPSGGAAGGGVASASASGGGGGADEVGPASARSPRLARLRGILPVSEADGEEGDAGGDAAAAAAAESGGGFLLHQGGGGGHHRTRGGSVSGSAASAAGPASASRPGAGAVPTLAMPPPAGACGGDGCGADHVASGSAAAVASSSGSPDRRRTKDARWCEMPMQVLSCDHNAHNRAFTPAELARLFHAIQVYLGGHTLPASV